MTSLEALKHWGMDWRKKKRLEEICLMNPDKYVENNVVSIPDDARPIYIPDKRMKNKRDHYTHIVNAVANQQELLPNSIGITSDALEAYIEELVQANILKYINGNVSKGGTSNCILRLQAEEWLGRKVREKREFLLGLLNAAIPNGLLSPISLDV